MVSSGKGPKDREAAARAVAFFEACDDIDLMRRALSDTAPRVRRIVQGYVRRRAAERIPAPADLTPAPHPATREEALATLREVEDFALLQALTRAIGRRVEELEGASGPA